MKVQLAGCVPCHDRFIALETVKHKAKIEVARHNAKIESVRHNAKMTAHNSMCIAHLWTGYSINRISANCQSIAQG